MRPQPPHPYPPRWLAAAHPRLTAPCPRAPTPTTMLTYLQSAAACSSCCVSSPCRSPLCGTHRCPMGGRGPMGLWVGCRRRSLGWCGAVWRAHLPVPPLPMQPLSRGTPTPFPHTLAHERPAACTGPSPFTHPCSYTPCFPSRLALLFRIPTLLTQSHSLPMCCPLCCVGAGPELCGSPGAGDGAG